MNALTTRIAALIGLVAILLELYGGYHDLRDAHASLGTRQSLRRLAALTIRNFPARDLDSPDLFWKSIGRDGDPMRDSWGNEYRLTSHGEGQTRDYFWTSAGPDGRFGTRDDIVVQIPYPNGPGNLPDLGPNDALVPPPLSNDAK